MSFTLLLCTLPCLHKLLNSSKTAAFDKLVGGIMDRRLSNSHFVINFELSVNESVWVVLLSHIWFKISYTIQLFFIIHNRILGSGLFMPYPEMQFYVSSFQFGIGFWLPISSNVSKSLDSIWSLTRAMKSNNECKSSFAWAHPGDVARRLSHAPTNSYLFKKGVSDIV
jgi:hypothetical protein